MTLAGIKKDDVVRCDVRGDRFWALVLGNAVGGGLLIETLIMGRPIPVQRVKARQVVGHWRQRKGSAL